jgi:3-hydroxyacyl-CoA dehydrogenase / enoyl-CoA hydratase / 3-hydroxybutyryl-CoA epimerase
MTYKNLTQWRVKKDDQTLWLGLDRDDGNTNTINEVVLKELKAILDEAVNDTTLSGLVIYSAKDNGFIYGADLDLLKTLQTPAEVEQVLKFGHDVLNQLEAMPLTTVAMIDGFCLGGGTELALACDYRIACDDDKTRIGLPEVMLGFHPGWGGTVRLPKLIGLERALPIMLTGQMQRAKKAKRLKLVNECVPRRQLKRTVEFYLQHKPAKKKLSLRHQLTKWTPFRQFVSKMARKQVASKVKQAHYPGPFAIIDLMVKDPWRGQPALDDEIQSVVDIIQQNDTVQNLIRVFFLRERLKKLGQDSDFKAQHVHVVGAGVMGGDIAAWCALQGLHVTLQDQSIEQVAPAIARAHKLFKRKLRDPRPIQAAMDRLMPDVDGEGIANADVIIEAIVENVTIKRELFKSLEAKAKPSAILATNTTSIPLEQITEAMEDKTRLVGIHFFNPVSKMLLVEIIEGPTTSPDVLARAMAFTHQIDRLPVPVKSSPGFVVNRILMPYLMECMTMLQEGLPATTVDKAARDFGMPMGPVELADMIGLDVCLAAYDQFADLLGSGQPPKQLQEMVEAGKLGRKSGEGFYRYSKKGKLIKPKSEAAPPKGRADNIAERLISRMLDEANAVLREGVIADADLLDAAMIFGTGFAPFRGGPMHYQKTLATLKTQKKSNDNADVERSAA